MVNFLGKIIVYGRHAIKASPTHKPYFLQNLQSLSLKCISTTPNQDSFTVSYLINSCGLSPESALSASRFINLESPEKPDSVLNFFKSHGFSQIQISSVVRKLPQVLLSDPEKTLFPKLDFLYSRGVSSPELTKILSNYPGILKTSLRNQIIPAFNFFSNFLQSDEKTIAAIKRFPGILTFNPDTYVAPIINLLRENGVPEKNILTLFNYQPRAFVRNLDRCKEIVEEVHGMGFNPLRLKFALAVFALSAMSKTTWERKVDVYKRWGLSEDEIYAAFGRHPWCMTSSENKIMAMMDFFVNKMGLESSVIAKRPVLISFSFEKRVVPRGSVVQVLWSKGLAKKDSSLRSIFEYPENLFLKRYVNCYEKEAPQLLKLYKEKLDLSKR